MPHAGRRAPVHALLLLLGLLAIPGASGRAQQLVQADRGPRFLTRVSATEAPVPADLGATPVLRRRISLAQEGATLGDLLASIREQTGLRFIYSADVIPVDRVTGLRADNITVGAALTEILLDTGVDVVFYSATEAGLVKRMETPAAPGTVSGRVTDATTGEGIVGAEVGLEGGRTVVTGEEGRYRIGDVAPGSYTLVVRRIGYARRTQAVVVGDGEEVAVDVALKAMPTQLDEVVTTVTGEQRLRELGHVVGRINADSLVKEAPVSSLSELLNGRVPGLQVFQSQGTVGGQVALRIRGPNTLSLNTEPIVIVDGVRYNTGAAPRGFFGGPGQVEPTSPLNDLNPNDIETIEVVKGPSAATLYGTDAANGVLVITTKRGQPGPARWNAYAKGTATAIPSFRYPDAYWGWGTVRGVPSNVHESCTLEALAEGLCTQRDSTTVLPNPLNDPALSVLGRKPRWEYGASVAGGRQDLRYYFSGDYEDATGPLQMPPAMVERLLQQRGLRELPEEWREPNAFTKLNLRANVSAGLGETADLRVNAGYVHSATRSLGAPSPYARGAFVGAPTSPYGGFGRSDPAEDFVQTSTERTDRFFGNASGQWRPMSWLTARASVGIDLGGRDRYSLARRGDAPNDFFLAAGAVQDERVRQMATTAELGVAATARRGRLSARTAVGVQYVRRLDDLLASYGEDLPPGGTSVGEAARLQSRQQYAETVTLGGYIEETLGFNERLFLTGALRLDGASAFGRDYEVTAYPKVSASWLVTEEPFLPRLPGLEELRLRYAFGASGQQPTSAMARPEFFAERAVQDGGVTHIVRLTGLGNPELRPERVREHEFGFDVAAIGRRLQVGLTWYRRRTVDQIATAPLPAGLGSIYTNLGLTTQRGFEAELTARVLDTRLLSWDLTLQHSVYRTKLVDLGTGDEFPSLAGGWKEGYSLGARFMYPLVGYTDVNGDGIIVPTEVQIGTPPVYRGESTPPRSQTLTAVVGLFERRLRLSALLERRTGFTQVNELARSQCELRRCRAAVDPSASLAEQAAAMQSFYAARFVEPGDFTRLREVTAAVDLPLGLVRALRVRSATLALSARNVALWTDFSGPDPESASMGMDNAVSGGVAEGIPQGRTWTLRLDLGL